MAKLKINPNNKINFKKKDYSQIDLELTGPGTGRKREEKKPPTWSDYRLNSVKSAFLELFSKTGHVKQTCEALDVSLSQPARWRRRDPEFAEAYEEAKQIAAQNLEDEAYRRAVEGVDEPVFFKGDECGTVKKYSDSLLTTLLKGNFPEKYRERYEHTVGGPAVKFDATKLNEEELETLDRILAKAIQEE